MKMTEKERRINILVSALTELEKEYDKVFDEMLMNDTESVRSRERMLFHAISTKKKELEKLKGDNIAFSDEEIEDIATGVDSNKQDLTEAEDKFFDAIAENF